MTNKIIRINGLFGHFASEIDLDNRCSILIGANGVGKTTILHIIKCILELDFIELARHDFESIDLITENAKFHLNYDDLFPSLQSFLTVMQDHTDTDPFINSSAGEESVYSIMSEALHQLKSVRGRSSFQKYLSACYFHKPFSNEISRIISASTSIFLIMDSPDDIVNRTLASMLSKLHLGGIKSLHGNNYKCFDKSEISNEEISVKLLSVVHELQIGKVIFFDAVRKYTINSELSTKSTVFSKPLYWISQYNNIYNEKPKSLLERSIYFDPRFGLPEIPKDLIDEVTRLAKKELDGPHYERRPTWDEYKSEYISSFGAASQINVNKLISHAYYDDSFIQEMNNKAITYYKKLVGKSIDGTGPDESSKLVVSKFFYDSDVLSNIENYWQPIMLNNSLFCYERKNIESFHGHYGQTYINLSDLAFYEFYKNEMPNLMNYKNEKINLLKELLVKYFVDKNIIITPAGLRIFKLNKKSKRIGPFKLIKNEQYEIPLDSLSSGEKKLILLLVFSIFFEESTLIFDEPEISLSIIWQEKIIPDIMSKTNLKRLIVATHSPFIASDESTHDSLIPLPNMGEEDE